MGHSPENDSCKNSIFLETMTKNDKIIKKIISYRFITLWSVTKLTRMQRVKFNNYL